jgi:hypothetical protein
LPTSPHRADGFNRFNRTHHTLVAHYKFFEVLLKFVHFKLYHSIGMRYPPNMDAAADSQGATLGVIRLEQIDAVLEDVGEAGEAKQEEGKSVAGKKKKGTVSLGTFHCVCVSLCVCVCFTVCVSLKYSSNRKTVTIS